MNWRLNLPRRATESESCSVVLVLWTDDLSLTRLRMPSILYFFVQRTALHAALHTRLRVPHRYTPPSALPSAALWLVDIDDTLIALLQRALGAQIRMRVLCKSLSLSLSFCLSLCLLHEFPKQVSLSIPPLSLLFSLSFSFSLSLSLSCTRSMRLCAGNWPPGALESRLPCATYRHPHHTHHTHRQHGLVHSKTQHSKTHCCVVCCGKKRH